MSTRLAMTPPVLVRAGPTPSPTTIEVGSTAVASMPSPPWMTTGTSPVPAMFTWP